MDWQEIQRRLLEGLYGEARANWGRIAEIEDRLGISDGYLAKLCQGKNDFKLSLFLRSIEALDLDPRAFLSRTLEIQPATEDYLRQLEAPGDRDPAFTRMARATAELEAAEPPPTCPAATAGAGDAAEVAACRRSEQLRRLRASRKYRTHAFASAYLEHLDSLRYDHAEEAARLATRVAVHLIPTLPGPQDQRLTLQCLALGIFGSARRLKGKFTAAARAFRLALDVSRRAGLREDTANLLLRASYLLKDFGHFNRALALSNEALVISVQLGSSTDIGRTLLQQGMTRTALGDYEGAVLDLKQAFAHFDGAVGLGRHHLALYQYLAYAYEQLGKLDEAHECLDRGAKAFEPKHAVDAAKVQWLHGTLAFRHGEHARAEKLLRTVREVLASKENPAQEALVSLDLVSVLLAQGKNQEASELAESMARLLFRFKNNRLAEAAIVELISAALEGGLNEDVVGKARRRLKTARTPRRGAPPRR